MTSVSVRPRQEVELAVMATLYRELARLTQEERNRAMSWVNGRLAADATASRWADALNPEQTRSRDGAS